MKNEAWLRPMKRAFGTLRGYCALRFTAATPPLHTSRRLVLHIREANASFFRLWSFSDFYRCIFSLDRFEPPHRYENASNSIYEKAHSFHWTDPNYRKPNTDLLKTKKKPSSRLLFYIIKINTFFICVVVFSSFICYN